MAPVQHGHNRRGRPSPTYRIWGNMVQRCTNTKNSHYKYYGARGILVCDRWRKFANFLSDMGEVPSAGYSIERNDPDGNYELSNCCWLPTPLQARTKRYGATRKLDEQAVAEIRGLKGTAKNELIAARFGVTKSIVAKIYRGELWAGIGL